MHLEECLTVARPFGQVDHTKIEDIHIAIELLDLYEPFSSALRGRHTLIYGRKGCGKSAVISLFQGYIHVQERLRHMSIPTSDLHKNSIFITIRTWDHFLDMNISVQRQINELASLNTIPLDYDLIPVEKIEEVWVQQIWEQIFRKFYELAQDSEIEREAIPNVILCFDDDAMANISGTPEYVATKIFQDAKNDIYTYLVAKKTSIFVLFDSLEKYPISNKTFGASMGGFLRAINRIDTSSHSIRIIFALPEELLPSFHCHSENLLKDFENSFALRWKPKELFRIILHRYRLFLSAHDKTYYERLRNLDFSSVHDFNIFFNELFPQTILNELNIEEDTRAYLIRHTQLLPRHLILVMNHVARNSFKELDNFRMFSAEAIVKGVSEAEELIAEEILKPYQFVYQKINKELKNTMGDLPPIFSYGKLQKCLSRISKKIDIDNYELTRILFQMGIIGRVRRDQKNEIYTNGDFFFNFSGNISFSGDDILCFHPIFSRFFNCNRRRNGDKRLIYPNGITLQ